MAFRHANGSNGPSMASAPGVKAPESPTGASKDRDPDRRIAPWDLTHHRLRIHLDGPAWSTDPVNWTQNPEAAIGESPICGIRGRKKELFSEWLGIFSYSNLPILPASESKRDFDLGWLLPLKGMCRKRWRTVAGGSRQLVDIRGLDSFGSLMPQWFLVDGNPASLASGLNFPWHVAMDPGEMGWMPRGRKRGRFRPPGASSQARATPSAEAPWRRSAGNYGNRLFLPAESKAPPRPQRRIDAMLGMTCLPDRNLPGGAAGSWWVGNL
ncbi:hypothetical protein BGZ61DRAFT_472291 [Ilyonectria robusta]|uniref:uncharacterized protein n=1 Tax=Ilyonectria robusta TaxID=1079257 RepID=UPI001E8CAD6B|nr:uncharacterized protein BGZ61DRAFT_472291 [Ilyonectria robusta]KAH8735911.1 hypothetical protein BGZ61DRAFT_472291 [Ilyonectria robusta]